MEKQKSTQSRVMSLAWRLFRANYELTTRPSFGQCLKDAWCEIKKRVSYKQINVLLSKLQLINAKGTREWWSLSTKRSIKKSEDPEVHQMIESGCVPLADLINIRRRTSNKYTFTPRKDKMKRPRIHNRYGSLQNT